MNAMTQSSRERMMENLPQEHGHHPTTIEGTIPAWLDGTLYRNGPGLTSRFGQRYGHAFEGDGAITAVRFSNGEATFACRVLQTRAFEEEARQGKQLYGFGTPWWRRMLNQARGKSKTPANVNVFFWQGDLYALPEGAPPLKLDSETLAVLDEEVLDDLGVGYHSAHPHYVAERESFYNYRIVWGKQTMLSVFAMPDQGRVRELVSIPMDGHPYFHDFIATPTHLLFFIPPVRINLLRAMFQIGPMPRLFDWQPEHGTQVLIVPIDEPGAYRRLDVDPFFLWHFAHARVEGTTLSATYARWADFSVMEAIGDADAQLDTSPILSTARIDFENGTFTEGSIAEQAGEFPQSDQRRSQPGLIWALTEEKDCSGIVAVHESKQTSVCYSFDAHQIASEPVFIPHPDGEHDHGLIASLVYDGETHRSFMAIFDAQRIEAGPVAKVWFDHHIPMTFHGTWVPAVQMN